MVLSQPPSYSVLNIGTLLIVVAVAVTAAYFITSHYNSPWAKKIKESDYAYSGLFFSIALLFIVGVSVNIAYPKAKFVKTLEEDLSTQIPALYGVELSEETLKNLVEVSSETVGSEIVGTTVTDLFTDVHGKYALKYQVSSNGAATLLAAPLDFKELETKTVIEELDVVEEIELDEAEIPEISGEGLLEED